MQRLGILGIVTLVVLMMNVVYGTQPTGAQTGGPPDNTKIGHGVHAAVATNGEAAVVVALSSPSYNQARQINPPALRNQAAALQDDVLAGLPAKEFRLKHKYQSVPALAGTVTQSGLAKLVAHPNVLKVDLDVGGSGSQNDGGTGGLVDSVPLIGADLWHAQGITGDNVVVAILDSGLDTDHDDLASSLIHQECFLDNNSALDGVGLCPNGNDRQSGAGAAEDDHGHGTHVSGIVSSDGVQSSVGTAPGAQIISIKVLDSGNSFYAFSEIVAALDYIINNRPDVQVINMSLGTGVLFAGNCDGATAYNMAGAAAVNTLRANGVIIFASSANNSSTTQMSSPACLQNVVSVGATDKADNFAPFTNRNATLDILAPGVNIISDGLANSTAIFDGTSMASPHAAGCAALLIQAGVATTPDEIETFLKSSTISVTDAATTLTFPRIDCTPVQLPLSAAIVDNSLIQLGIHAEGHLNVTGGSPSLGGTTAVGLRFLPTNAEATAPGCLCEGWGAADTVSGVSGYANVAVDGVVNISVLDFFTGTDIAGSDFAVSQVEIDDNAGVGALRVTHDYHESITANLYEATVTIENISNATIEPRYRRVMDWDVEPTAFNEFVTIDGGTSTALLFSSDNGFASANPLSGPSSLNFTGNAVDSGPGDIGALFDFGFDPLAPGERVTFNIYYGAAQNELQALLAIDAVNAEVYSLGQPNTPAGPTEGTPNTFIFAFSAVGGAPVERITVRKKADFSRSEPGTENGYTLVVSNPTTKTVTLTTLNDTLPAGFTYVSGSTTGLTTANPTIVGQTHTWNGPFAIPPGQQVALHFQVQVASTQLEGIYYNSADGQAIDEGGNPVAVRAAQNVAGVEVPPPVVVSEVDATASTGSVTTDPSTGEVTVAMPVGNRSDVTIVSTVVCPNPPGGPLTNVTLKHNGHSYPMTETPPGSNSYAATIPAADLGRGPIEIEAVCNGVVIVNGVGEVILYDPSGIVTDAVTGLPLQNATVTLYHVPSWRPDTGTETRDCRILTTRGPGGWTQPAPTHLGVVADPNLEPAEIDPTVNPQTTNAAGRYGWNVVAGCWYVTVAAEGYVAKVSPVVGVPPEVTDLDIALTPIDPVAPVATIAKNGANIELTWTDDPANQSYEVHRSLTPFFTPEAGTLLTTLSATTATYTDVGAAGNPSQNHFYIVRATVGSQHADSNEVGEIDYALNNTGGKYSLIALPFPSTTINNAASLASAIGNVSTMLKWNPTTQTFRLYTPPTSAGDNFPVSTGDAIFVALTSSAPAVFSQVGNVTAVQYTLQPGGYNFIALPLQRASLTTASAVAANITHVTTMLAWNPTTQAFRIYTPPTNAGDNFAVTPGMPFIVQLDASAPTTWP